MQISAKQKQFLDIMEDPQVTELLIGGSSGGPLVYGSKVITPFGEKKIEDIKVGDQISNAEGGVSRVIDVPYDGVDECYRITFRDGAQVECSERHIWKYKLVRNRRREHLSEDVLGTTIQLAEKIKKYNVLIPLTKPVVFTRSFPRVPKMDAYVLGVILGDGGLTGGNITITNLEEEIIEKCRKRVSGELSGGEDGLTWRLTGCAYERDCLRRYKLMGRHSWEKFIPERYKLGSIEDRLKILRGLLDTDGTVDKRGHLTYTTTSKRLGRDVQFIIRSLGGNATISEHKNVGYRTKDGVLVKCRSAYTVYIQHEHKEWLVSLSKKLARIRPYLGGTSVPRKRIMDIKPIGRRQVRCISVSNLDGLFLTNDFVVTHNSKSYAIGLLTALWAKKYPGVKFFIGRRTLKSLKQTTIATMLNKVFPAIGLGYDEYRMHFQDMTLDFANGSQVIFGELEHQPSDSEFNRYGSLEFDVAIIDEAGEVVKTAKDVLRSRAGRGILAKEYDLPGRLLLASNPSQGWLKTEYYDPWSKLEGGDYRKWQIGEVEIGGVKKPSYRAFMRMSAYDNPFVPQSYIDNLKALPDVLRRKLLDGDWNYADEDNMLFKAGLLDKATTYEVSRGTEFDKFIGVDVSAGLGDKTVYTLIENGVVTTCMPSKVATNWDKKSELPIFRLMGDELIEFAQRNGFSQKDARRIAVEGNGLGQALVTVLKERGWNIQEYTATHKSRSENYYQLSLDMDSGLIKLYHDMACYDDLRKELSGHTLKFNNQVPDVCKKEEVKMRIGHSPDFADSLEIACWIMHQIKDRKSPQYNSNRILF